MGENTYILIAVAVWNVAVFFMFGADKLRAKEKLWRIPEKTLLTCAFLLGGFGALLGMVIFRHKTKNDKFKLLIPIAAILCVLFVAVFLKKASVGEVDFALLKTTLRGIRYLH